MDIAISTALAAQRHPDAWSTLAAKLPGAPVSVCYELRFHAFADESICRRPCPDPLKTLLSLPSAIKHWRLAAQDAAGTRKAVPLDLATHLSLTPQTLWPIEIAGEDPALRVARRAAWPTIELQRQGRPEQEAWRLAGIATRTFRGKTIELAQLVRDERTALLLEDPADPARLVCHDLVIEGLNLTSPFLTPPSVDPLWERVGRSYPGYLAGHRFIDPMTDQFSVQCSGSSKNWSWHDAASLRTQAWISRHLSPLPGGYRLVLEDATRLDVRDYRDDQARKPRMVLRGI